MNDNGDTVKYLPLQQLENSPPPNEENKEEAKEGGKD